MIIKTLSENTSVSDDFGCEHGLSLYIETEKHKILFDTGASGLFAKNAERMGVELQNVDIAVISHDHYDHGGGLATFMALNSTADIYISREAFSERFAVDPAGEKKYIGLNGHLLPSSRFIETCGHTVIDGELELFSGVHGEKLNPTGNRDLLMVRSGQLVPDDFAHEQNLVIKENGHVVLIAGCAHNGIINIIEHMMTSGYGMPSHVVGGFHLYNKSADRDEEPGLVRRIGTHLNNTQAKYYTCHCTGIGSYNVLKEVMGDGIGYLSAGSQIII